MRVSGRNLKEYLGKEKYRILLAAKKPQVGVVRGLAWTSVGGDTLEIEVNVLPGKGRLELTGKLGEVMQESAKIALTYVKGVAGKELTPDFFEKHDIHIHVPEGAVPKDGPSAGVTLATALYSAVTGRKVRPDIAMTGEISLVGNVMAIGGLKEKVIAAGQAGIKQVFVPQENEADVEELEAEVVEGLTITKVQKLTDIWKEVFVS